MLERFAGAPALEKSAEKSFLLRLYRRIVKQKKATAGYAETVPQQQLCLQVALLYLGMSKSGSSAGKKLMHLHDVETKGRKQAKEKADTEARLSRSVMLES
jgi:hypothetical protein